MNIPSLTSTLQRCLVLSPAEVKLRLAENIPELSLSQWMCKEFPPLVVPPQSVSAGSPFQTKSWRYGGFIFSDFLAVTSATSHRPLLINAGIRMLRWEFRIVTPQRVVACRSAPRILKVFLLQHDFQTQQAAAPGLRWKKEKLKPNNSQQKKCMALSFSFFNYSRLWKEPVEFGMLIFFSFLFFLTEVKHHFDLFLFLLVIPPQVYQYMHETITVNGCPEYQARATAKVRPAQMTLQHNHQSANHTEKKSEFSLQRASSWGHFIRTRVFHQRLDDS